MNAVDLLIILVLVLSAFKFIKAGLLELFLSFGGLIIGLLAGSRLAQLFTDHISGRTGKMVVIVVVEFGLAIALWMGGLGLSRRFKSLRQRLNLGKFNEMAGGVSGVLLALVTVWLVTSGLSDIRAYNIGREVRRSLIIRELDMVLPPPPDVMAQLERVVSPHGFPNVFLGYEPEHITVSPTNTVNDQGVLIAEKSVVKVRGVGCGQVVSGTGFVVDKNLVVTNAHVVAGITRPQVVDARKTFLSTPIWFDPGLDITILKVKGLPDPPLSLSGKILPDGDAATTLGFPGTNALMVHAAAIIDHLTTSGRNIYNEGVVSRDIYEVQADIQDGDSGGPLLGPDGAVAGVVFARAVTQDNVGFALMIDQIKPMIDQAKRQNKTADTSFCT